MKNKKVAFIHYPHHTNAARLETMPFALNSVICLAKTGWEVDLYLWEEPSINYHTLLPESVNINYLKDSKFAIQSRLNKIRSAHLTLKFLWVKKYSYVFGLGQIGAHVANTIAKSNKCPFIYYNDEFPSFWGKTYWNKLEQEAVKNAAMIVVPDSHRFYPLSKELDISKKPYACLPNIPMLQPCFEEINWHEKLGIPQDSIPFLHAGSIDDGKQIPEVLSGLHQWHKNAVLILHSRFSKGIEKYRKTLSHLESPEKVVWSYEPISEGQLNSLVSYCAGNFALYRNSGPNIEYMGFSSGKLMRSLSCGSPVIASNLPSLSFIKDNQLGVLVNHPREIPAAIEEIIHDREAYRERCLHFCAEIASFEKAWNKFIDQLKEISNVDI